MGLGFFSNLTKASGDLGLAYTLPELLYLLGNSFVLGGILTILTYYTTAHFLKEMEEEERSDEKIKLILGSMNVIYLCIGLTTVMLLVNNNLARAFSIGAAIALVRFRIKLTKKSASSNIFFGIIAGIACGLNEISVAWITTGIYLVLSLVLYLITRRVNSSTGRD